MSGFLSWRGHALLALLARLYLAYVLIFACLHKIAEPAAFAMDVATYQFLPLPLINLMAIILPWLELVTGLMLVLGLRVRAAALLIAGMMVMFMIALGWALYLGLDMSCGCFASQGEADSISGLTMWRDAGWLALSLYVLVFDGRPLGVERLWGRRASA